MGSEVRTKVTHGDGEIRNGNKEDSWGGGSRDTLGSGLESWFPEHGHVAELYIYDFCTVLHACSSSSRI